MQKMELLAPAGGIEKLETAFEYGADAAYMGLKNFSLRTNAQNFGYDQAQTIRDLKKKYGKKLYCTSNIYFQNSDIQKLKDELKQIESYPFDAFIVSDIGVFDTIKNAFPEAEMHLSTQANCINSQSAKMYRKMGFDRIILGRETPLREIRKIKDDNPDLKLEAFVHGAMCMAYSGRCLLSAHMTGRSANRGDCAHSCRWNYRLAIEEESRPGVYYPIAEENDFTTILSSKDLCMIDHLQDLKDAGVDSLKIEGRMKSIYYVATVTRAYRKALDHLYDPSVDFKPFRDELYNVSHREYSTGFFYGNNNIEDDINIPTFDGYVRDYQFLGSVKEEVKPGIWSIEVKNQIKEGEKIEFIGPDVLSIEDPSVKVLDMDFNPVRHIDHCNEGFIRTDLPLKNGYILRKEI